MKCVGHVTSRAPHVGVCDCAASAEMSRLSRSALSNVDSSCMQLVSSFVDGKSVTTDDAGLKYVGEVKMLMFKTYSGPPTIHMSCYERL